MVHSQLASAIIELPEYNLKDVNLFEMHRTGGVEVMVLFAFRRISVINAICKKK